MTTGEPLSHRRFSGVSLMIVTGAIGGIATVIGVVTALVSANGNIAPPTLPGLGSPAGLSGPSGPSSQPTGSGQTTGPGGPAGLPTGLPTDLPTLPTDVPTTFPTSLPSDFSSLLPTGGTG